MRLWTLHPRYLDAKGLVALWREGLLAYAVLRNRTIGYRSHPQLERFRAQPSPPSCMRTYLAAVLQEAGARGYDFDRSKIRGTRITAQIEETAGQLRYEWMHLKRKLRTRAPERYRAVAKLALPDAHPLFRIVPGPVRDWERVSNNSG
jgi:hypothetical protein